METIFLKGMPLALLRLFKNVIGFRIYCGLRGVGMKQELTRGDFLMKWMRELNEEIREAQKITEEGRRIKRIKELEKLRSQLGELR
jgi:hypothetical protein